MPRPFKVARVEKTDAPDGGQGQDWYRYVLESGRSTITGHRCGSRKDVLAYATQCAEQLNTRGLTGQSESGARAAANPRQRSLQLPRKSIIFSYTKRQKTPQWRGFLFQVFSCGPVRHNQ